MILVNSEKLLVHEADNDNYILREQAREYRKGLKELKDTYRDGKLTLTRAGFPKYIDGIDAKGREIKDMKEPTPPAVFPLSTYYSHPKRGKELWECCLGTPKILPGNLWGIGSKKNFTVTERLIVDINQEPDFAYFLMYLCRAVKGGHLKIEDPIADVREKGDKKRQALQRENAIWQQLNDEGQLRKIAGAYGVSEVNTKEPDAIRFELETILKENDQKKKKDPSYKGTEEFLEDMKITDYVRLSAFIRHWIDEGMITYNLDGRYKVGDKVIAHVPTEHVIKKFPWICNYFSAPNNADKLQSLMKDLVNKDYLDTLTDNKDFRWIAGVMEIPGFYNQSQDKVRDLIYKEFVV